MDIVKNNIVSIIFGVIALVALTTPLWLIGGYAEDLQAEAEKRKSVGSQMESLLNKPRTKPAPTPEGQPQPLDNFPNDATIRAGEALRDQVASTATQMVNAAIEMNRRAPLVPDALPRPRNNGNFRFRDAYNDQAKTTRIIKDILHGGIPPTAEEIKAEQDRVWLQNFAPRIRGSATGGGATNNQQEIQAAFQAEAVKIPARMTLETAQKIKMYVDPNALTWHPAIQQGGPAPTAEQIWYAQLGLWIQENVAEAIAETNANAKDVRDAVVKHLVRIEFPENPYVMPTADAAASSGSSEYYDEYGEIGGMGGMGGGAAAGAQVPTVMPDPTQPLPKQFDKSITGRVSNALFDVTHFRVVVIVDATRLPLFLHKLSEERFLYVRGMQMESVDAAGQQLAGYIYGPEPVMQVTLDMEMLFMRGWTMDLMPDRVRIALGIPPVSAIPPAGEEAAQ